MIHNVTYPKKTLIGSIGPKIVNFRKIGFFHCKKPNGYIVRMQRNPFYGRTGKTYFPDRPEFIFHKGAIPILTTKFIPENWYRYDVPFIRKEMSRISRWDIYRDGTEKRSTESLRNIIEINYKFHNLFGYTPIFEIPDWGLNMGFTKDLLLNSINLEETMIHLMNLVFYDESDAMVYESMIYA